MPSIQQISFCERPSCRSTPICLVIAVSISPCVIRHFRTTPSDASSARAVSLMLRRLLYSIKTSSGSHGRPSYFFSRTLKIATKKISA